MSLLERLQREGLGAEQAGDHISVRPSDADQVQALVRACREERGDVLLDVDGLPPATLWPRSGEANGGADARIRVRVDLAGVAGTSLDRESHLVTAGAGVPVASLEEDLISHGFTLGLREPPARALGAWLAEGEPGPGTRRAYPGWSPVAALEAVLLQGSFIRTSLAPRSATGPDPKALLVGGGGRLGVITRATLRVYPAATARRLVMAFVDPADALGAVVEALGREMIPDALGLLDGGVSESLLTWETSGEPERVAKFSSSIDEVCALNGGRRTGSTIRGAGETPEDETTAKEPLLQVGAAGPSEVRAAAARLLGNKKSPGIAVGFGARWSRIVLVRRALINQLGGGVRLHIERALPEGGLGIACVRQDEAEAARAVIRQAGGFAVGDEDGDSWIDGVAFALLGEVE